MFFFVRIHFPAYKKCPKDITEGILFKYCAKWGFSKLGAKSLVSSSISTGVEIVGCWITAALFLKFIVNYISIIFKLYIYYYRHHLYNWSHVFNPIQSISKMVTPGLFQQPLII